MSLERLVDEVRRRSEDELRKEESRFASEARRLLEERDRELRRLSEGAERQQRLEIARLRAGALAKAKLEGRRIVFEARAAAARNALAEIRSRLADVAGSAKYAALLKRMHAYAVSRLGKSARIAGRADDAALLKGLAGKNAVREPIPVIGGFVAESADGSRRLDLSFDELLRRREDRFLELVKAPGPQG